MVAAGIITSKLVFVLPLIASAPDYLMRALQVQQMAAARAVVGPMACRWSNLRILSYLGWLNVRTFGHQAILHYNRIPAEYRSLGQSQFKAL